MFTTNNSSAAIHQEIYSQLLLTSFDEFLINQPLFSDFTADFPHGDELLIPQIGDRSWTDYEENTGITFVGNDMSRIPLTITEYKQDAFFITDKMKSDAAMADRIWQQNILQSTKRIREMQQSHLFQVANDSQVSGSTNGINGRAHRFVAPGTDTTVRVQDLNRMKTAFDKARAPKNGRVLFIDATQEEAFNNTQAESGSYNIHFEGIVTSGFEQNNHFIRNIAGFDIIVTDLLPRIASETIGGVSMTGGGVANIAMVLGNDLDGPMAGAMRQAPTPEFFRNSHDKRDEWSATARWGYALKRPETLGVIVSAITEDA